MANSRMGLTTTRTSHAFAAFVALAAVFGVPEAGGQQVLEVGYNGGRPIIDDEWRAMGYVDMAIDRTRAILYLNDSEEPDGVMAFSLDTGRWLRTIRTPTGDGPYELTQGKTGIAIAPGGGLYVAGLLRVIEFDSLGIPVDHWQPDTPMRRKVCGFGDQPAIPAQNGVIRRRADGTDEGIGPDVVTSHVINAGTREAGWAAADQIWDARIACSEEAAYVVLSYGDGPDSVLVYRRDGESGRLVVPTEFTEGNEGCQREVRLPSGQVVVTGSCPLWNQMLHPSLDAHGNVVLLGRDPLVPGAIVDPRTNCYAVLTSPAPDLRRRAARIYQDSLLVFQRDSEMEDRPLGPTRVIYGSANRASLYPLRRVSGRPCPGMLPSLGE